MFSIVSNNMMNFCTLFDSYYIHKGIALYLSLKRVSKDFHLYVMAFDRESYEKLNSCGFDKMTVELFDDFETPELKAVKPTRTKAEYCWTCGPSVIHFFLMSYGLSDITYLDADLYFLSNPSIVFDEIGNNSVAITEQYIDYSEGGKYCVQFMYFRKDKDGLGCLEWWRDRCIEWCYSRYEDGKFGDQKYLEKFEELFENVYVVQNRGVGIAPWNAHLYTYGDDSLLYKGKKYPYVFFHMHGTKVDVNDNLLSISSIDCEKNEKIEKLFFIPYAELLCDVYNRFLGKDVSKVDVRLRTKWQMRWIRFRGQFRSNRLAKFVWYKVLGKKYDGHETKKV